MVEPSQDPPNQRGNHPRLRTKKYGCLIQYLVKNPQSPGVCYLPTYNTKNSLPLLPCFSKINHHHWTVIIQCCQNLSKVLGIRNFHQRSPVGLEGHLCTMKVMKKNVWKRFWERKVVDRVVNSAQNFPCAKDNFMLSSISVHRKLSPVTTDYIYPTVDIGAR